MDLSPNPAVSRHRRICGGYAAGPLRDDAPVLRDACRTERKGRRRQDETVRYVLHSRCSPRIAASRLHLSGARSRTDSRSRRPVLRGGAGAGAVKKIQLITDGACQGNPGPGGWAAVLRYNDKKKELWGCEPHTTNNRMELTAAIEGLRALREDCEVEIVTDSEYMKNGITTWIHGWKRKGWMTAAKKPVVNQDLWKALDEQVARHKTAWTWTKGHANHADNNRCDELATRAAREQSCS